jgi:hypothetical protein
MTWGAIRAFVTTKSRSYGCARMLAELMPHHSAGARKWSASWRTDTANQRGGEWMGADKHSSRKRWKLQQDEHGFQHTSSTHYPSWPSPRSHWSATGPRNQHTTFRPEKRSGTPNLESTDPHRSGRWAPPVRLVPASETEQLSLSGSTPVKPVRHTGQTGRSLKAPKAPNRPTDHQTDPNSKQQQHGTTTNTPTCSPEQNPTRARTGQTGVAWAARDEQHSRVNSRKSKSRSPESLHGLEQDFGDIMNTSWGVHSEV